MNDNPPGLESNAIEEENNMNGEHTVVSRDDECTCRAGASASTPQLE
jgi:hypothetical protein